MHRAHVLSVGARVFQCDTVLRPSVLHEHVDKVGGDRQRVAHGRPVDVFHQRHGDHVVARRPDAHDRGEANETKLAGDSK